MKQILINTIFVLLISASLASCAQESKVNNKAYGLMLSTLLDHSVSEIAVSEIDTSDTNLVFIDARELAEFKISHIEDAIHVGYDNFDIKDSTIQQLDKQAKIIVYCSVGYRSEKIAEQLLENSFKDVSNLYGGIFEWKNQNRNVVDTYQQPTEKVHAFDKTWGVWLRKGEKVY